MEGGLRDDHPCMNPDLCPRVKGDDERNGKCETLVREYCSAENSDCTPVGCSAAMEMFNDLNHLEHAKSLATGKSTSEYNWYSMDKETNSVEAWGRDCPFSDKSMVSHS